MANKPNTSGTEPAGSFPDTLSSGAAMVQPFLFAESTWVEVRDANATGRVLFRRHYSYKPYRDGRNPAHFVGPGQKMVLLTPDARALFVWRKFISRDDQQGVNCAAFRNEGNTLSSTLIREAVRLAWNRWPGERLYTYVNPRKARSSNPGCCFFKAGWRKCGITKARRLLILELWPLPSGRARRQPEPTDSAEESANIKRQ